MLLWWSHDGASRQPTQCSTSSPRFGYTYAAVRQNSVLPYGILLWCYGTLGLQGVQCFSLAYCINKAKTRTRPPEYAGSQVPRITGKPSTKRSEPTCRNDALSVPSLLVRDRFWEPWSIEYLSLFRGCSRLQASCT